MVITPEQAAAVERLRGDLLDAHFNAASDIRTLLSLVASLTEEVERLRGALADVANPFTRLRKEAEAAGHALNEWTAAVANEPGYLRSIATDALATPTPETPANG